MKKALVPMVMSLALCGAATAALLVDTAGAQTEPRRPVMVAMTTTPHTILSEASPQMDGGGPLGRHMPTPAEMAARHKQMCQDAYAHEVGELAYLEARLSLTATQQPLFERWKNVKLDIAKRGEATCSTRELPQRDAKARPTPLDGMAREEDMLKRRVADLDAERPVLGALYNSFTDAQKNALLHPNDDMGRGMMGRRMFAQMGPRHDRMGGPMNGPGPMNGGPMGGPGAPPPPPAQ